MLTFIGAAVVLALCVYILTLPSKELFAKGGGFCLGIGILSALREVINFLAMKLGVFPPAFILKCIKLGKVAILPFICAIYAIFLGGFLAKHMMDRRKIASLLFISIGFLIISIASLIDSFTAPQLMLLISAVAIFIGALKAKKTDEKKEDDR